MAADIMRERQRNDFQDAMNNVEEMVMNEVRLQRALSFLLHNAILMPTPHPFFTRQLAQGKDGTLLGKRAKPKYRWKDMEALGEKLGKDSAEFDMTLIRRFFR